MLFFRPARCRTLADVSAQPHVARPARGSRCRLRFGEGLPTAEALWKGAVGALVIAFCWALGVWAAVGPEPSDDDGGQDGEAVGNVGSCAAWRGRVLCFVLLLGAFALVCSSQISDMLGGECSLARGFGGMLLKAMAVAAVVVPVWLDSRRSKW